MPTDYAFPVPVPEELIYRDHGGMSLACGHKSDGFIRGTGNDPRYHCPVCRTAEESIYAVQARDRHAASGWEQIFARLRARLDAIPDLAGVAEDLVDLVLEEEGAGHNHGHLDEAGVCRVAGEDCYDCERLDRIRAWVEARVGAEAQPERRAETDYLLQIDYTRAISGGTGTMTKRLGVVTEEQALEEARAALELDTIIFRVEVYAREVPIEWTKVEEVRRGDT